jgi:hypothetical protein
MSRRHPGRLVSILLCLTLSACTSSSTQSGLVASVAGDAVTQKDVQSYVAYSWRFHAWNQGEAHPAEPCRGDRPKGSCTTLWRLALARLIQERIVLNWARRHRVSLSAADSRRIQASVDRLLQRRNIAQARLSDVGITRSFLTAVLTREMLVRKVERMVGAAAPRKGPSMRVRKFVVPLDPQTSPAQRYRQALDLATDGRPVPPATSIQTDWTATFRIPAGERVLLSAAKPGQYAGPFRTGNAYLVVELLQSGVHAYGRPARLQLEANVFDAWLARAVRETRPVCYAPSGRPTSCPAELDLHSR